MTSGNVRCWGWGANGQLGYNSFDTVGHAEGNLPVHAGDVPVGAPVSQIAVGSHHTCALLMNGNVRCWGLGTQGGLGYGNTNSVGGTSDSLPADVGDVPFLD